MFKHSDDQLISIIFDEGPRLAAVPDHEAIPDPLPERLYIVVGDWLSRGAQCAQTAHAVAEYADEYPNAFRRWVRGGNTIIVLEARSDLLDVLSGDGVNASCFIEPDFDFEVTARAFGQAWFERNPTQASVLRSLPLAGSVRRWPWDEAWRKRRENKLRGRMAGT